MFLHDSIADAEAEAGSLADGLGGVKRIEDAVGIFHSRSVVCDFDAQSISGEHGADPDFAFTAFFDHSVHGVIQNVQENLLELVKIPGGERQLGFKLAMDANTVELHVVFSKD